MGSRNRLVQIHRWAALSTGLFLALMGITGAILIYKDPLEAWAHPERLVAVSGPRFEAVLATARASAPEANGYVMSILSAGRAVRVDTTGAEPQRLYIDPRDGRLISRNGQIGDGLDFAERLHTHFLGGEPGEIAVGVLGTVLVVIALTGLVQGWPRRWRDALRVRWNASSPWLAYDLHRAGGLLLCLLLVAQAITGISMVFSGPASRLVNWAVRVPPARDLVPPRVSTRHERAPLDAVIAAAEATQPGARATRVTVPTAREPITIRLHTPSDRHPSGLGTVQVDPYDATVLAAKPLESLPTGRRMFDWIYPLHTGQLFGAPQRGVQAALGIAMPSLLCTGIIVWAGRRKSRRRAGGK